MTASLPFLSPAVQRTLPIRNAWIARTNIRVFNDAVNDWRPFVGGKDVRVRYSRYETGFDFSGYPSTILGPFTMIETSNAGWYYYPIGADEITIAFSALVGQTVYQIIEAAYGGGYYYFGLGTAEPLLVIEPRVPLQ